jgi:hypothetical protein
VRGKIIKHWKPFALQALDFSELVLICFDYKHAFADHQNACMMRHCLCSGILR